MDMTARTRPSPKRDTVPSALRARKVGYYVRSSVALAGSLRRRRDFFGVALDPSRELQFKDGLVLHVEDRLDLLVAKEILCDDIYGLAELADPRLIVDVGAGTGTFAVVAARRFPGCRVLAFEPDPLRFAALSKNAAANGAAVESLCVAVGTQDTYRLSGKGARSSTVVPAGSGGLLVPGRPLAEFIGEDTVDLLKIDCEGAELDVLRSLSPGGLRRVTRVVLEYHNFHGERNDMLLASHLAGAGYELRALPDPYEPAIGYLYARMV